MAEPAWLHDAVVAGQKCRNAVAVAVEACAEDTKGQTCYICTEAFHWKTKEGLVRGCACRGTAGFAHVSCLAEQAKILVAAADANNSDDTQWHRWDTCSLCKQKHHGVVRCALGWTCWKTYLGRPETDTARGVVMSVLGNGLSGAKHHEDALAVQEADWATMRRLGDPQENILIVQHNLARTYRSLGRFEESVSMQREVYSGHVRLFGEEDRGTFLAGQNYALSLLRAECFEEAKSVLRKSIPVAQRAFGESDAVTLQLRRSYGRALYRASAAKIDDLREAVAMLEETAPTAQRVLGGAHPLVENIERHLRKARAALRAREEPLPSPWEAYRDDAGMLYYHNHETGESVWTLPEEAYSR